MEWTDDKLTKDFTITEMTLSSTAMRYNIKNVPDKNEIQIPPNEN